MNKIKINIPEGFEIDNEKSNFSKGVIEFKPIEKKLNYGHICDDLFLNKQIFFINGDGTIGLSRAYKFSTSPSNAISKEQLECLMAYNKLRNVAEYLNKSKLDWENYSLQKYFIYFDHPNFKLRIDSNKFCQSSSVYFCSKELAEQAIKILGEEEIKKALFINEK